MNRCIGIIDTSVSTYNIGDYIIMDSCKSEIKEVFSQDYYLTLPRHSWISGKTWKIIKDADFLVLCWTNWLVSPILIKPFFRNFNIFKLKNKIVLLWVWWWVYQKFIDPITALILRFCLSKDKIHSVRDEYTLQKLKSIWINNVINTSCPTLWRINLENISTKKSDEVIFTLTKYNKDFESDKKMMDILVKNYKKVYFWPQEKWDLEYFEKFWISNIEILASNLDTFNNLLLKDKVDYIWTRLHAWVRAMQKWVRTIIIWIDNRSIEISKDTNICVIERKNIWKDLENKINENFSYNLTLNQENIKKWKNQF